MRDEQLDEIEKRANAATEGPWVAVMPSAVVMSQAGYPGRDVARVVSDGDGWVCPSCGTAWGYNDYDEPGTLYEAWSGEELDGDPVPAGADWVDDPKLLAKSAELRREKNTRIWGCEHGFMCDHGCRDTKGARAQ